MIAHGAPFASGAVPPIPIGERIADSGEGIGNYHADSGEGIADTLARLADRLAVLATAAHIMERRAPRDVYARSIAHEACVLALDMRDTLARARAGAPMRSPVIVDAAPDAAPMPSPTEAPEAPDGERSTHHATRRDGRSSTRARHARQTPPEARSRARASERATHPDARPSASLDVSGADRGPTGGEMGGAQ